jgi:hypothetical protein
MLQARFQEAVQIESGLRQYTIKGPSSSFETHESCLFGAELPSVKFRCDVENHHCCALFAGKPRSIDQPAAGILGEVGGNEDFV